MATMLVGNKSDLENIRDVSVEEGKSLAEEEGLFFIETSALDSTNVSTAFEIVIRAIYDNIKRKVLNSDSHKAGVSLSGDFDYVISKAETDIMRPQVHHGGFGAVAMAKGQEVDKGISVKIYLVEQVKQGQILEVNPQVTSLSNL
ncbi:Ras-related protein RabA5b-like protein [Tanacetum coccineum]